MEACPRVFVVCCLLTIGLEKQLLTVWFAIDASVYTSSFRSTAASRLPVRKLLTIEMLALTNLLVGIDVVGDTRLCWYQSCLLTMLLKTE
jgi:hypothetical protein